MRGLNVHHSVLKPVQQPDFAPPLLAVRGLSVSILTDTGVAPAVRGVSLEVSPGEILAVVGESGSGKSVTFLTVMGLLRSMMRCEIAGSVSFNGQELTSASPETLRRLRGRTLSMIFQDPLSALNPVFRVGDQIANVLRAHEPHLSRRAALSRAVEALDLVRIPSAGARARDYPHQFSGGMRQRAMIAMAIACRPKLLIADEPTTALDVTTQSEILDLLDGLRRDLAMALVLITHDLGIVARYADRIAVMYGGRVVEQASFEAIFSRPAHPYTTALLQAVPKLTETPGARLASIAGEPSAAHIDPAGCAFEPRCGRAQGSLTCRSVRPELKQLAPNHEVACHRPPTMPRGAAAHLPAPPVIGSLKTGEAMAAAPEGVLRVDSICKSFSTRTFKPVLVHAVADVSFEVARGETLGVVGESGSGKSTLARLILRLIEPTSGRIFIEGRDVTKLGQRDLLSVRDRVQVMFQDSRSALNPRMRVEAIVGEPLMIRGQWRRGGAGRVRTMLKRVGLSPRLAFRYPHEFSGGQQQRIALARALMLNPALLVLDEPVSSLDVSIRAQIINLLKELQEETRLSYVFIAHDLAVVRNISHRIAVMYVGRIVELGPAGAVCDDPLHPYTRALVDAVPVADPTVARARLSGVLVGDAPSPITPPSGCPFHPRCRHATDIAARGGVAVRSESGRRLPDVCATQRPALVQKANGRWAACHFV